MRNQFSQLLEIRREIPWGWYMGLAIPSLALPLLGWSVLSYLGLVSPVFLPTPTQVLAALREMLGSGNLLADLGVSLYRVLMGFLLSVLLGVPLGLLMGTFKGVEALTEPLVDLIRYMPASAFIPLIMLWIGIGEGAKVAIIFIGTFFQLVLLVADVSLAVSYELVQVSYTLGARRGEVLSRVILKASLPGIVDALRITLGWAWTYLVVAELVAANSGLGFRILKAQRFLLTSNIFVGILMIGILGLFSDYVFKLAQRKLFPWAETSRR